MGRNRAVIRCVCCLGMMMRWGLGLLLVVALLPLTAIAQTSNAERLVTLLAQPDEVAELGISHGWRVQEIEAARSLDALGDGALPALELALRSVVERGVKSEYAMNADLLAHLYAKAKARRGEVAEGDAMLRRLLDREGIWQAGIEDAMAWLWGLSGYASANRNRSGCPMPVRCWQLESPSKALADFISAWLRGDQRGMTGRLSATSAAEWQERIDAVGWLRFRAASGWREHPSAVGFRFEPASRWRPRYSFLPGEERAELPGSELVHEKVILTNAQGRVCGEMTLRFHRAADRPFAMVLMELEKSDQLLQAISKCSAVAVTAMSKE